MDDIFDYLDYRDYLADHYQDNKKRRRSFSFRYITLKTGLDASFYAKVLNKQKHIADNAIPILTDFLKLKKRERDYFTVLVHFNKSKRAAQEQLYFEKLLSLRTPISKKLEKNKYDYFSSWYNIVIREQMSVHPFSGNVRDLAARLLPRITPEQAKRSVKLLEKLGLIQKESDGSYRATEEFISTDGVMRTLAVRTFQKEALRLAGEAIERVPKKDRDITTLTISASRACLEAIRERLTEVRGEILQMVQEDTGPEEVYQLNFQVFPLTQNSSRKER
ncbi:MAG: TIGR02147 family protein [Chitinivibrionales bacterium]|nr:TIGR02147 family protein [Chitinivibrionales bacterium]